MIPQQYVDKPELGALYMCAWGYRQEPCVLTGFGKNGHWQVAPLRYNKFQTLKNMYKASMATRHSGRLVRVEPNILNQEDQQKYQDAVKLLKQ